MASLDKDSISILRLHPDPHTARAKEKLLDLVCTHSPDLVHQNLAKTRVKDSGTWLFNLPVFEEWQKTDTVGNADAREGGQSNCIWLNGNVGAGKTMLMSALIDHLLASVETLSENKRKKTAVVYYYFDRSLPPSPRDAIASLLRQLCSQTDTGPLPLFLANRLAASRKVSRSNDSASDTITTDSDEEFLAPMPVGDLIADFLSLQLRFDMVYICLDGLEECDDLIALFELLARLVTSPSPSRLAISARPQIVRPGTLANIGSKDMVVNLEQHNAPDIQCYFETHTKKHGYFSDMIGPEALPDYIKTWAEGCRGNFLAATAETVELNRLTTKRDVDRYVDGPNIGFPELFSQIWSRLNDQPPLRATLAKRIFYWLSMSRRTLTLKELQQAIAIEPGEYHSPQVLELDEMLSPPELIEEVCMGFVRVSKVNNSILTHPSALPFYFYQFDASFAEEAREYAAKCCVWFLNIKILSRGSFGTQTEFDKMDQEFPFLRYVSQHWGTHLKHSRGDDMQVVAERLLEDYRLLDAMSQLLYVNRPAPGERRRYDDYPWGFGRKHFEAYFHLEVAFGKQIYPQEWKVRADDEGRKPLHVASISPSLNSRHVLFHTIWDLDDCGRVICGEEPLKHEVLPTLNPDKEPLVTNEDDSSTEDGSEEFRFELVSTLPWMWDWTSGAIDQLNMRVPFTRKEMITPDKQGKTPLHHFIVEWSEDQLSHLLNTLFDLQEPSNKGNAIRPNTGADEVELLPALADCDGRTILDYACVRSSICVDLVVNTSKWSLENISSAATAAAAGGHLWPLKRLLKLVGSEFEPETLNLGLKTAITEASKRGFTDIIRLICQRGVDISEPEQDEYGMTALHHAAYGGHLETVRYLLTEGADPNRLDKFGETPLFCASKGGSRNVASILISRGADPNVINNEGFNPVKLAARNGNLDVVKLLLHFLEGGYRAAEPRSRRLGAESKTPLHFAVEYGHGNIIELLLDEGSPHDSKDSDGRSPLSYACQAGLLPAVELLLEKRVDVNSRDSGGRTPLSYAAAGGHVEITAILLWRCGADHTIEDSTGRGPEWYAHKNGHKAIHDQLLKLPRNFNTVEFAPTLQYRTFRQHASTYTRTRLRNQQLSIKMFSDPSWEPEFCLYCDRQTDGALYCSESCRLRDFESSSPSLSTTTGSPSVSNPSKAIPHEYLGKREKTR